MTTNTHDGHHLLFYIFGLKKKISLICLCILLLASCAQVNRQPISPESEGGGLQALVALPATFIGQIPCEDCERVDIVLNVRPDFLYQLRKTYQMGQGAEKVEAQMGRWRFSSEENLLLLGKQKGLLKTYVVVDNDLLRFVEWEGADNRSQIQYDLVRSLEVDPFTDVVKMRGMFSVREGRASFVECSSSVSFAVDKGAAYETTVQNYMNTPHDLAEPLLLSILANVQGGLEPETGQDRILIDQFRRFYPNRDCEGNTIRASFTGTYWQLVELDGVQLEQKDTGQAPYLTFNPDKTLHGYGGCNKIVGSYLIKGDVFLFNRGAMSRLACPEGMDLENLLIEILDESESYRVDGDALMLIDQSEKVRARFVAGP